MEVACDLLFCLNLFKFKYRSSKFITTLISICNKKYYLLTLQGIGATEGDSRGNSMSLETPQESVPFVALIPNPTPLLAFLPHYHNFKIKKDITGSRCFTTSCDVSYLCLLCRKRIDYRKERFSITLKLRFPYPLDSQ